MLQRASKHTPNTQWNDDRPRQAYEMALLGLTLLQMSEVMGVNVKTLEYWQSNKPEFREKLLEGRELADIGVVKEFYKNCFDRYVEEEEVHVIKGQLKTIKVKKFIQGDKWAQNKWMSLRQRDKWAEKTTVNLTQNNITNIGKIDLSILSMQELQIMEKAGLHQLKQDNQEEDGFND